MKFLKILFLLLFLLGCSDQNTNEDKSIDMENFNQNTEILYQFRHGIIETDEVIEFNGSPIILNYKLENTGNSVALGLFIAIDGILQEYKINENKEKMHIISAGENETKTVQIELYPNTGNKGEEYNINFFTILQPETIVKSLKEYTNQHSINQLLTKRISFLESAASKETKAIEDIEIQQMSQQDKERYVTENNDVTVSQLDNESDIQILQNDQILNDEFKSSEEVVLQCCGPEGLYEIIEFNDMVPNALGSIEITKDCFTKYKKKIKEGVKNYFVILIKKGVDLNAYAKQSTRLISKD